jgi:stage IV sporulation protein FB
VFAEPQPTAFDLHWRMFGIDVRVHPLFWVMSAVLGWGWSSSGLGYLLLWVLCVFVSILLHEVGHVVMGWAFGSRGYIVLYTFGGLAFNARAVRERWQRILVSFAGPLIQLVLFGFVLAFALLLLPKLISGSDVQTKNTVVAATEMLLEINLLWPLLNLLPIYPLDGGQISREVFEGFLGQRGTVMSLGLSLGVAGLLAVHCLMAANNRPLIPFLPGGGIYTAILFGLLAVSSYQMLQLERSRGRRWHDDERQPWE